jgi:hypothetical protein
MVASLAAGSAGFPLPSVVAAAGLGPVTVCWAVALVAGVVLALVAVDGLPAGPPRPPLSEIAEWFGAEGLVWVAAGVGVAVVLQTGGGLPPRAPAAAGLGRLAKQLREPGGPLQLQRAAGRAAVPAELPNDRGVAGGGGLVAFQEPGALLLLAAQLD